MRRIPLGDARPGLVLGADALNAQQMLLLKKGASLTAKSLHTLKSWGVEAVWVAQPEADDGCAPGPAADHRDLEQALAARFGDTLENPVMAAICEAALRIVSERS